MKMIKMVCAKCNLTKMAYGENLQEVLNNITDMGWLDFPNANDDRDIIFLCPKCGEERNEEIERNSEWHCL